VSDTVRRIKFDDRSADILWEQSSVDDVNEAGLLGIAQQVASRGELKTQDPHMDKARVLGEPVNPGPITRKLRGPRHPFE
jgi:hypothetical protein